MDGDNDIRVIALADQLRDIDLRFESAEAWRCSPNQRRLQLVSNGLLVVSLARIGVGMVWSIPVLLVLNIGLEPFIRWLMKRRAEEARTRVFNVLEAIDQSRSAVGDSTRTSRGGSVN